MNFFYLRAYTLTDKSRCARWYRSVYSTLNFEGGGESLRMQTAIFSKHTWMRRKISPLLPNKSPTILFVLFSWKTLAPLISREISSKGIYVRFISRQCFASIRLPVICYSTGATRVMKYRKDTERLGERAKAINDHCCYHHHQPTYTLFLSHPLHRICCALLAIHNTILSARKYCDSTPPH